jgi:hypothetical protein
MTTDKPRITATAVYSRLVREGYHPAEVDDAISRPFLAGEGEAAGAERLFTPTDVDILREWLCQGRECGMWGEDDGSEPGI